MRVLGAVLCSVVLLGLFSISASEYNPAYYAYDNVHYVSDDSDYAYEGGHQVEGTAQYNDHNYAYNYDYNFLPTPRPSRRWSRNRGLGAASRYRYTPPVTAYDAKSYGRPPAPKKEFVPVVIKKKTQKKRKILTTSHGFFVRGGTAMFGKFKDLHSCEKACEITPTCFAGDFNPWLGKCFLHSNLTACGGMTSHKAITHFRKVPCQVTETPRGTVVLGASTLYGIEIKGVDTLQDCIKCCVTAGNGIAAQDDQVGDAVGGPQICCNIDFDFATHKCFHHPCINNKVTDKFCVGDNIDAPVNSVPNPSAITITFCPLVAVVAV